MEQMFKVFLVKQIKVREVKTRRDEKKMIFQLENYLFLSYSIIVGNKIF